MANVKFTDLPNLGTITDNTIVPVVESNDNFTVTAANLQSYVNSTTGNVTASYFIGNGSQLTGLPEAYGNANVAAYLPTYSGALNPLSVSAIGNVTAQFVFGNGSQLTGLPESYGNANVAAYLPTYSGALTASTVSTTGNITGNFLFGNGSQLTGMATQYANANAAAFMASFGANNISTTGNITAGVFSGDGSGLTNLPSGVLAGNLTGNVNGNGFSLLNAASVTSTGSISAAGNITGANINGNLTGDGSQLTGVVKNVFAGQGISVSGSAGNVTVTNNNPTPYTNANVAAYLPSYTGTLNPDTVNVSGNITANNASIGNNINITNTTRPRIRFPAGTSLGAPTVNGYSPGARIVVFDSNNNTGAGYAIGIENFNMWFGTDQPPSGGQNWGFKWYAGNVAMATLSGSGNLSVNGNITGVNFIGNGSQLTGLQASLSGNMVGNINGNGWSLNNINNITVQGTISSVGNITTANTVSAGTVRSSGTISAAGNIIGGNISVTSVVGSTVTTNNLTAGTATIPQLTSTGNVIGNLVQITGSGNSLVVTNGNVVFGKEMHVAGNIFANVSNVNCGNLRVGDTNDAYSALFLANVTVSQGIGGGGQLQSANITANDTLTAATATVSSRFKVPVFTVANKPTTGNQTGDIIAISDSPTHAGKLAYWAGGTAWRYVSDDTAV